MPRENVLYDIPDEWKDNLRVGHCWCGKPRSEFDKRQKIYCSQAHSDEFNKRIKIWSVFKNNFLEKVGEKCSECGMTKEKFDLIEQQNEDEFNKKQAEEYKEAIDFERARLLIELDKEYQKIFDDGYVFANMNYRTREEFGITYDYSSRYMKKHFQIDVDHIHAVSLGGDMWDEKNLRPLCNDCHKGKTKEDMHKLKYHRKAKETQKLIVND